MTHPDPEIARYEAERDLRQQNKIKARRDDEESIIKKLGEAGVKVEKIWDLLDYGKLDGKIIQILLEGLGVARREDTLESIIRMLCLSAEPFDGRPLLQFLKHKADPLEFPVLNTIAVAKPRMIDDWLNDAQHDDYYRDILRSLGYRWKGARPSRKRKADL